MAQTPHPLRGVLGNSVDDADLAALQQLRGWPESQFLEFKSNASNEKIARAIASFANAAGGLFVLGMPEAGDAVGIEAVADQKLRIEKILYDRIQPPPSFSVGTVDLTGGRQVVLVAVEPSPLRPHALVEPTKLSYPIRRGASTAYLTEPEVGQAYSGRYQTASERRSNLMEHLDETVVKLGTEHQGWLSLALIPTMPGVGTLSSSWLNHHRQWLNTVRTVLDYRDSGSFTRSHRVGFQGAQYADDFGTMSCFADLRVGGAGSASVGHLLAWSTGDGKYDLAPSAGSVAEYQTTPATLVQDALHLVELLVDHARYEGAADDTQIVMQLVTPADCSIVIFPEGTHDRSFGAESFRRDIAGPGRHIFRTVNLTDAQGSTRYLLGVTRSLVTEMASEFGIIDLGVVTEDDELNEQAATRHAPALLAWARESGAAEIVTAAP